MRQQTVVAGTLRRPYPAYSLTFWHGAALTDSYVSGFESLRHRRLVARCF
jgi:hypothetical protein